MSDASARLELPYIQAAQAQKHITHNEALALLDVLVQAAVEGFGLTVPPAAPEEGQVFALGGSPVGAWAGHPGELATWANGAWAFVAPQPGWHAAQGTDLRLWTGTDWAAPDLPSLSDLEGVGINTGFDATNRLAISSPASLFGHEGSGHQLKINKAVAGDTASVLFQTGFSGRAEFGTAGSDDFSVKVSPDGSTFHTALTLDRATGRMRLGQPGLLVAGSAVAPALGFDADTDTGLYQPAPDVLAAAAGGVERARVTTAGLQVTGTISGTAITQSATDTTTGRLLRTRDFGIGVAITLTSGDNLDAVTASGFYFNPTGGNTPGNNYPISAAGSLLVITDGPNRGTQIYTAYNSSPVPNRPATFVRSRGAGPVWGPWDEIYASRSVLRAVSLSSGVPTGGLIERGTNANGDYVRFADGTQICTGQRPAVSCQTAQGSVFSSASVQSWTYPAAFAAGSLPVVSGSGGTSLRTVAASAPGISSVDYRVLSASSDAASIAPVLTAVGRWA